MSVSPNDDANHSCNRLRSKRQIRAAQALMSGRWVRRDEIDLVTGSSNGPDVIGRLRSRLGGRESIELRRIQIVDGDGKKVCVGEYKLSELGRAGLVALLAQKLSEG